MVYEQITQVQRRTVSESSSENGSMDGGHLPDWGGSSLLYQDQMHRALNARDASEDGGSARSDSLDGGITQDRADASRAYSALDAWRIARLRSEGHAVYPISLLPFEDMPEGAWSDAGAASASDADADSDFEDAVSHFSGSAAAAGSDVGNLSDFDDAIPPFSRQVSEAVSPKPTEQVINMPPDAAALFAQRANPVREHRISIDDDDAEVQAKIPGYSSTWLSLLYATLSTPAREASIKMSAALVGGFVNHILGDSPLLKTINVTTNGVQAGWAGFSAGHGIAVHRGYDRCGAVSVGMATALAFGIVSLMPSLMLTGDAGASVGYNVQRWLQALGSQKFEPSTPAVISFSGGKKTLSVIAVSSTVSAEIKRHMKNHFANEFSPFGSFLINAVIDGVVDNLVGPVIQLLNKAFDKGGGTSAHGPAGAFIVRNGDPEFQEKFTFWPDLGEGTAIAGADVAGDFLSDAIGDQAYTGMISSLVYGAMEMVKAKVSSMSDENHVKNHMYSNASTISNLNRWHENQVVRSRSAEEYRPRAPRIGSVMHHANLAASSGRRATV